MMKKFYLFSIVLSFISIIGFGQNVGSTAPDFTLDKLSGGSFTLSENDGKVVFVFVMGYGCSTCIFESASIKADIVDAFNSNENFIAIHIDAWDGSSSQVTSFKNQTNLPGTYLLNASSVASSYKTNYSNIMVINKERKLVHKSNGSINTKSAAQIIESELAAGSSSLPDVSDKVSTRIFPNPTTNFVTIDYRKSNNFVATILDYSGRVQGVYTGSQILSINTSNYANGTYFIKIEDGNNMEWRKLVVR
ncbi:MAG: T9SS type A sorting domain-containing protein [Bacteroidales bacterium]|nr:T9SS type A sorting domain-containing protein [Bacteroidales bacterium]